MEAKYCSKISFLPTLGTRDLLSMWAGNVESELFRLSPLTVVRAQTVKLNGDNFMPINSGLTTVLCHLKPEIHIGMHPTLWEIYESLKWNELPTSNISFVRILKRAVGESNI